MFRSIVLSSLLLVSGFGLSVTDAEAARIGGGRSFGVQRQIAPMQRQAIPPRPVPQQQVNPVSAARPTTAPPVQQTSGWRKWAAPLAGLAAGIGLAALLSHFGLGGDFAGILLLALGALVVFVLVRRLFAAGRTQQEPAYAGAVPLRRYDEEQPATTVRTGEGPSSASTIPAGFDTAAFERQAKLNFIRLQAANDACNLADIRDFTTPEVFAEIKLAIDERGGTPQRTDVVMLEAEVLEVAAEAGQYIASVHYSGTLREEESGQPQAFNEVWHLTKPVDGNRGWVLAGIQQLN